MASDRYARGGKKIDSADTRDRRLHRLELWTAGWEEREVRGQRVRVRLIWTMEEARRRGLDLSDWLHPQRAFGGKLSGTRGRTL